MLIVRQVRPDDLDSLWNLIRQATTGMTSLQIDRDQLADRIERSHFAFLRSTERAEGAPYVFVMEDTQNRALVGTSCVFSKTGGFEPFYAYRVVSEVLYCELLRMTAEIRSLHLTKIHNGPTEIGSLFLLPEYRGRGCGKLMSLSRFAYMAAHPKRFANQTIAEMRGNIDALGHSPFWDAIGAHFFRLDFPKADMLSMVDKQFIEDLMPRYPIYLELLPPDAVASIGQVHEQTRPALAMLDAQGFKPNGFVDIFDGGPVVECKTTEIKAIQNAKQRMIVSRSEFTNSESGTIIPKAILSSSGNPFVSIQCEAFVFNDHVAVNDDLFDVLHVKSHDLVWVIE